MIIDLAACFQNNKNLIANTTKLPECCTDVKEENNKCLCLALVQYILLCVSSQGNTFVWQCCATAVYKASRVRRTSLVVALSIRRKNNSLLFHPGDTSVNIMLTFPQVVRDVLFTKPTKMNNVFDSVKEGLNMFLKTK